MGIFDFLPCCGRRAGKDNDPESDPLVAPHREGSIISQDAYGAVSMSTSTTMDGPHGNTGTLSSSAKARIDQIGREVGNHMLPINAVPSRSASRAQRPPSPSGDSTSSRSRPPTPSPARPRPEGGVMSPPPAGGDDDVTSPGGSSSGDGGNSHVVHKSLFNGAPPRGAKNTKRGGAKGRGSRGKSRKQK